MSTRAPQGVSNSASRFQDVVEPCSQELSEHLKAWLDDFLLYCLSDNELLKAFLRICHTHNLVNSLKEMKFFLREATWCGRVISSEGVIFNPQNLGGLRDCSYRQTGAEHCKYFHCVRWMSSEIPMLAQIILHLKELEKAHRRVGRSKKMETIGHFRLSELGWCAEHERAFDELQ